MMMMNNNNQIMMKRKVYSNTMTILMVLPRPRVRNLNQRKQNTLTKKMNQFREGEEEKI